MNKTKSNLNEEFESEDLKLEIKSAIDKCNELDENQRIISKTILKVLELLVENCVIPENEIENTGPSNKPIHIHKLSNLIDIDKDKLEQVFDFHKDDFKFMTTINGKKEVEKQFDATLITLTIYHIVYGIEAVDSKNLVKHLKWLGIGSLGHLAENLRKKEYKSFIEITENGKNFIYKINLKGIEKGFEIIKNLALKDKESESS